MSGVNNLDTVSYKSISNDVRLLYEGIESFKKRRVSVAEDFKSFCSYLTNRNFGHSFPIIEKGINDIIGRWNTSNPMDKLRIQLDGYFNKIAFVDQETDKIETVRQKLLQYPDRHHRKFVTDKINVFLQNINTISLAQVDKIRDEVIPNIHKMTAAVLQGFSEESSSVAKNKKAAQHLRQRVDGYNQYVDRFNLRQICAQSKKVAEQILQNPNTANPGTDSAKLKQVNQLLDQCMAQFKAEDNIFEKIKLALSDNRNTIWIEDYDALMTILERGACYEETPTSQLQARFDSLIGVKEKEITNAVSIFSQKIQSHFNREISKLRDNAHKRQDLRDLVSKMNQKKENDKKTLYMNVAKIVSIIAAIIFFIILMFVYWPWSGIIVGIIVAFIIYLIMKS